MESVKAADPARVREQLLDRRGKLEVVVEAAPDAAVYARLLEEVDRALEKIDKGTFGLCEVCSDPIERERLAVDPLIRNCIDHLTPEEQRTLERDLDLASQVQSALLPKSDVRINGWSVAHHFEAAGPVSGDYIDLIFPEEEGDVFYFFVGDITGKGISASILMAHLHAIFRSLAGANLPVHQLVGRANRIFCEATLSSHFATLVCGKADSSGRVEVCNAGHNLPLLVSTDRVRSIPSTGLPVGLFCHQEYTSEILSLAPRDSLVIYTDGLTEAANSAGLHYGEERLGIVVENQHIVQPRGLIDAVLRDLSEFRSGSAKTDDLTIMVIQRR